MQAGMQSESFDIQLAGNLFDNMTAIACIEDPGDAGTPEIQSIAARVYSILPGARVWVTLTEALAADWTFTLHVIVF